MKKNTLIVFFIFIGCVSLLSKSSLKLTAENNTYLSGDSLYKYQVEYKDPDSIGKNNEWDFRHLQIINEEYLIEYSHPDTIDSSRICGMEDGTRYYYRQQQDSVWALGFENYTTMMNYTKPELKLKFPFTYGDTLYSDFEGSGIYCNLLPLKVKGYTRTEVDAERELVLPDRKVNKALRVHSRRSYTEIGNDSLRMTLDTYSWYAKNIRYPVFESIKTTLHTAGRDTSVLYTSFYFSPKELNNVTIAEITDSAKILNNPIPEAELIFTEASMYPNPVIENLEIRYKLTKRAKIWFSIHNNFGQPMCQTTQQILNKGWHNESIKMGHLHTGSYIVYVHVDDMLIKEVVIKK